jgi:hypothetical protein
LGVGVVGLWEEEPDGSGWKRAARAALVAALIFQPLLEIDVGAVMNSNMQSDQR